MRRPRRFGRDSFIGSPSPASACSLLLLLIVAPMSASAQSLVLKEAPLLAVGQNGDASASLTLFNDGNAPVKPLRLYVSDFTHRRPGEDRSYLLGTTRTLSAVNDKDKPILDGTAALAAGASLDVRVTVAKVWEAGQSEARLTHGDEDIPVRGGARQAILKAIRIPAAYNVQIVSATPEAPEIHVSGNWVIGTRALVALKNSDPFNYRFAWKLRLDGRLYDGGQNFIDLAPGSSRWVSLAPPERKAELPHPRFLTAGTLKDDLVKGNLILEPVFEGDAVIRPLAPRDVPVTFRFSWWFANLQQLMNGFWIFVLLMAGGIVSIGVHHGIPNAARALALERRVEDLRAKLQALGTDVESRRRVMLEAHLPAIRRELGSHRWSWFLPSFAATLDTLASKVDMIQQWVEIAYGVSIVLHRARRSSELVPPTVFRWIQEKCAHALTPIESGFTSAEELAGMKADLKAAENYLATSLGRLPNADLEKEIREREARLVQLRADLARDYAALKGLVDQLPAAAPSPPLAPVDYIDRDTTSLKVDLLRAFDRRAKQLTGAADTPAVAALGAPAVAALKRLNARGPALLTYLAADTHESLRVALLFVNEMRQDVYADDALAAALKAQPPAVGVITSPPRVQAQTPCMLSLRFNRDLLNEASARLEWKCTWDFGDGSPRETGWEVFHSYEEPGPRHVRVTVADLDARFLAPPAQLEHDLTVEASPGAGALGRFIRLSPEMRVELVRTGIVLALAMFGLMATARQQVESLSFVGAVGAIFALGFGIDTIKNLALQRPSGR